MNNSKEQLKAIIFQPMFVFATEAMSTMSPPFSACSSPICNRPFAIPCNHHKTHSPITNPLHTTPTIYSPTQPPYTPHSCQSSWSTLSTCFATLFATLQCQTMDLPKYHGNHNTLCKGCSGKGLLLCCDYCPLAYHPACLTPPLKEQPSDYWMCPQCAQELENRTTILFLNDYRPLQVPIQKEWCKARPQGQVRPFVMNHAKNNIPCVYQWLSRRVLEIGKVESPNPIQRQESGKSSLHQLIAIVPRQLLLRGRSGPCIRHCGEALSRKQGCAQFSHEREWKQSQSLPDQQQANGIPNWTRGAVVQPKPFAKYAGTLCSAYSFPISLTA